MTAAVIIPLLVKDSATSSDLAMTTVRNLNGPLIASARNTLSNMLLPVATSVLAVLSIVSFGKFAVAAEAADVVDPRIQLIRSVPPILVATEVLPPATPEHAVAGKAARTKYKKVDKYDILHIGSRNVGKGFNLYSLAMEQELGRDLAATVDPQLGDPVDQRVSDYISALAQNLFAHSDSQFVIRARVFQNEEVNAFSLPGGYLYVSTGLIVNVQNEAELAGVLAHEIAHVAARHATKNESRRQLLGYASLPLSLIGGFAAAAVIQSTLVVEPLSTAKFSRSAEREADLLGVQYVYAAGYDPLELVHFFERYSKQEPEKKGSIFQRLLADHPFTADRISHCQQEIQKQLPQRQEYVLTTNGFDEMKSILISARDSARATSSSDGPILHQDEKYDVHP